VSRLITDEMIDKLGIDEIIEYREYNSYSLRNFQDEMLEMAYTITSIPSESNYESEVMRIMECNVIPEIRKLDDELKNSYKKLFGDAVAKFGPSIINALVPSIPTMTAATILGLTPAQIVLLGAAPALSGVGSMLPDMISYWRNHSSLKQNGLYFLLNFRNRYIEEHVCV
jgi:hypothetical protein